MKEKLKLALVMPPFVIGGMRDTGMKQSLPHIGLAYLAANVDREKVDVRIYDCVTQNMRLDHLIAELSNFGPEVVGFNTSTFKINDAAKVAESVKETLKGTLTIAGGDHASAVPEETLKKFASFDLVVHGEGELTLNEVLGRVSEQGPNAVFSGIEGTCGRSDGGVWKEPPRAFIKDLDTLRFPAFDLMPIEKYFGVFTLFCLRRRTLTLSTGRGCRFKCVFCNKTIGDVYRARSAPSVIEEMSRDIEEFGAKEFYITDESLLSGRRHALELCEAILKKGLQEKASWVCFARVDETDPDMMKLMKKAGCHMVKFGVESGSDEILKNYNKGTTAEQAVRAFGYAAKAGLETHAHIVLGGPGETPETIELTINFALKLNPTTVTFGILTPYPGTELFNRVAEKHPEIRDGSGSNMENLHTSGFFSESICGLSGDYLSAQITRAYRRFYMRPSYIFRQLRSVTSVDGFFRLAIAGSNVLQFAATGQK